MFVTQGLNTPGETLPYLMQGGIGLPEREYYLSADPKMAELRTKYQAYVAQILGLAGHPDAPPFVAARLGDLRMVGAKQLLASGEHAAIHGFGLARPIHAEEQVGEVIGDEITVVMLENHGVMVIGADVADAWQKLYFFEREGETFLELDDDRSVRHGLGKVPQQRLVRPEEVANAVLWLCLPGSNAINGQAIAVAGGEVQ